MHLPKLRNSMNSNVAIVLVGCIESIVYVRGGGALLIVKEAPVSLPTVDSCVVVTVTCVMLGY